jgi:hypothetical protein
MLSVWAEAVKKIRDRAIGDRHLEIGDRPKARSASVQSIAR